MTSFRACAIIPSRNHVDALDGILARLTLSKAIVVDDGSEPEVGRRIEAVCARYGHSEYRRLAINQGKGAAVLDGLLRAEELGFTHAVQIDADGQHDLDALPALLAKARDNPRAIVTGEPVFDISMPASRRFWRPLTNFWVRVNALTPSVPDAMCGFRVYPVQSTSELVTKSVRGRRMEFDSEVLVKARWNGVSVTGVPVRVTYPSGNSSNFDVVGDNVRLSLMHTRLFFGMLVRLPFLLLFPRPAIDDRRQEPKRWSEMRERGAYWGLHLLASIYRTLGRSFCLVAATPVAFYFFVTGREQRRASEDYLQRLWRFGLLPERPTRWTSFRHFMTFSAALVDRLAAWTGDVGEEGIAGVQDGTLHDVERAGGGVFVITAHIGSPDIIRAIAALGEHVRINVLMHVAHATRFNRMIAHFAPGAPLRAIAVDSVGVDTAILLSEAIANGEWVVMAGDRVPVARGGRTVDVTFLGATARLPQGPYILGSLLKAPAYVLFCVRGRKGFEVRFSKFADRIILPRSDREAAIRGYAALFARAMEAELAKAPLQWFNFFAFWKGAPAPCDEARKATDAPRIETPSEAS